MNEAEKRSNLLGLIILFAASHKMFEFLKKRRRKKEVV